MPNHPKTTIFSISSLSNILLTSGLAIMVFLVVVRPEASFGLALFDRVIFWSLHVGAGILAMFAASLLMQRFISRSLNVVPSVIVSGILGSLLVAPVYLMVDWLWPTVGSSEVDGLLDRLGATGIPGNLVAETIEILPWTLSAWFLINLPVLTNRIGTDQTGPDNELTIGMDDHVVKLPGSETCDAADSDLPAPMSDTPNDNEETAAETIQFLSSLPGIFGKDVIAVSSDLHYLNVFTLVGKTTVLGNLRDVVNELGERGMQVHRSHWIAHEHVSRVVNAGGQAACILSNGVRVPVSRRRWKDVREYYGQGVITRND